eukprot:scaffold17835_cov58-Phaeocystis_antarctica.AAC.5
MHGERTRLKTGEQVTRGAHAEHGAHVRDVGRVEAQRLVERPRALSSRKEGMHAGRGRLKAGGLAHARSSPQTCQPEEVAHFGDGRDVPVGNGAVRRFGRSRVIIVRVERHPQGGPVRKDVIEQAAVGGHRGTGQEHWQPGRRGLREAGANGGGTVAGDSGGAEEVDEDADVRSTQRRLVVEMGSPVGAPHAGRAERASLGRAVDFSTRGERPERLSKWASGICARRGRRLARPTRTDICVWEVAILRSMRACVGGLRG